MIKFSRKAALFTAGLALSLTLFAGAEQTAKAACPSPAAAPQSESGISPLSDVIGWRFKGVNGRVYKRLYNYSTGEWIGDWILIP